MFISACLIVKDDSELLSLKRSIASVIDYVDEVIVTANGSPVNKIEDYCSGTNKVSYYYHKWNKDFSDQRNFCALKVSPKADFYIWIDADDVLIGGHLLREIAIRAKKANLDAVFFTYWYACKFDGSPSAETINNVELTQMRERLLRPGSVVWNKRLHETPVPIKNISYKYSHLEYSLANPITWLHLGVTREQDPKEQELRTARNRELLELQLDDERKGAGSDPRTLLYLMKIYAESIDEKDWKTAIEYGNEYLTKSGWDAERAICCSLIGRCLGRLGREQEAQEFLFKSIKEYPFDPLLYLYLARTCYNLKQYREMKHWITIALSLDTSESAGNMTNILDMKVLATDLMMRYYFNAERNVRKAYESMRLLYNELPNKENGKQLKYLQDLKNLDEASESAHKLTLYYQELHNSAGVVKVVESMPKTMQDLPFAWYMYNKHKVPRVWKPNEICYYASFGKEHFEKWGPENLKTGIGGSETAVIQLSKEWIKMGYQVVVYCDCGDQEGAHDGVFYVNYFKFNPRDSFNILINWRSNSLVKHIKAKKIIIDMHDLYAQDSFKEYGRYDKIFVKSKFHRSLGLMIPNEKMMEVSNGI